MHQKFVCGGGPRYHWRAYSAPDLPVQMNNLAEKCINSTWLLEDRVCLVTITVSAKCQKEKMANIIVIFLITAGHSGVDSVYCEHSLAITFIIMSNDITVNTVSGIIIIISSSIIIGVIINHKNLTVNKSHRIKFWTN